MKTDKQEKILADKIALCNKIVAVYRDALERALTLCPSNSAALIQGKVDDELDELLSEAINNDF